MAKGKVTNKTAKGAKGRKNHGPKRHLHHGFGPKALRRELSKTGIFSKYTDFESFCLAMQSRGVKSELGLMWSEFRKIPLIRLSNGEYVTNRAAEDNFFKQAAEINAAVIKAQKSKSKDKQA